jgi:RNA polymerase sigma-70 factor, ECF subfamily
VVKDNDDTLLERRTLQLSDAMLLEGLGRGNHEAFATLFARHYGSVHALLYRLLGDADEAEDVAQEVFLKLYERPLAGSREHNLRAWLYRVATNLGYNVLRAGQRRRERHERADRERTDSPDDPASLAIAVEERITVRQALADLSEKHQSCLLLRYQGLSYAEIAEVLGVSPGSVGTILARAEADFRRKYLALQKGRGES